MIVESAAGETAHGRPLLWTNSLPRKSRKTPGEFGFYEKTESCYDLTTLDFSGRGEKVHELVRTQSGQIIPPRGRKKSSNGSNVHGNLVRTQSGQLIPPRGRKKSSGGSNVHGNLVRTQSGQLVPPRLKKSISNVRIDVDLEQKQQQSQQPDKVPPTPPKRKKHLQIEKINQLFMNFVNFNGQEGMQLGIESNRKSDLVSRRCLSPGS